MSRTKRILPNLIIGGSPKCGTSSLFFWLKDHPDICASSIKETGFMLDSVFSFNKKANYFTHGLDKYSSLFPDYKGEKVVMEATPSYLVQEKIPFECLSKFENPPHIIFIFRKPSSRIFSDYNFKKNSQKELDQTMTFPGFLETKSGIHSKRITKYADFLSVWYDKIGRSNVTVIILEELKKLPKEHLIELSKKLGIDEHFWETYNFDVKNQTVNISNVGVHKKVMKFSNLVPSFIKKSKIKNLYYKFNSRKVIQKEDYSNELLKLDEEFNPEVEKLELLIGRTIEAWK